MHFDIHSHILPGVDDGASNLSEALNLLKLMQAQNITTVLATPHFYPNEDTFEFFKESTESAFENLKKAAHRHNLPKVYLGCEMMYYAGIKNSQSIAEFCLNNSNFLLLELNAFCINKDLFDEIIQLRESTGITPIIAHVERYFRARHFKKLINFLIKENIPVQINAASVMTPVFKRVVRKLINSNLFCVIATDAHSVEFRPPLLEEAFDFIEDKYGPEAKIKLIMNSQQLYKQIITDGEHNAKNKSSEACKNE